MKYSILLKSTNISILNNYIYFFKQLANKLNFPVTLVWKPTISTKITLLKSPHVNKKSKEHYGTKYFSCVIIVNNLLCTDFLKKILKNKPSELVCKIIVTNF